jgi:hypothetical protein
MNDILIMTFAFLLPLVPAYLLYRLLPSRTKVNGPFKGLNLQLQGSFAGYFLLVLMAFGFVTTRPAPIAIDEVWEVKGKLDYQGDAQAASNGRWEVRTLPANYSFVGDGTFVVRVPARRSASGKRDFPILVFDVPEHETVSVDLNADNPVYGKGNWTLSKDQETRHIQVSNVIPLPLRSSSYQPTGPAPQPTTPVASARETTQ